ncbi:MAG: guanine permease [Rhodospirillaceae bacterium]|nr:guanine permease [Rhodospirillaceae bacterium]|tara:strand:- start:40620 stop:41921 length:1302 start_codon:yes stop_codon:yes gene_type:complete
MLNSLFKLDASQTTVRTEVFAGLTTFLTMAYIIFVNPQILSAAGMDKDAVFVATCLAAAFGSLVMGFYANYPIALAPGMGLNAFFTFGVVKGMGVSWEIALAAVLISGILFLILSVLPVREWIINSIPKSQKLAIAAGIGFFLGFIGLKGAGLVVDHPATLVHVGDLVSLNVLLAVLGFIVIVALDYKKIPGAIIIGILVVAVAGMIFGLAKPPAGIVSMPPDPSPTFFALDLAGFFKLAGATMLILVFSFLLVDMFDTAGTLIGLGHQAKMLDKDGNLPNIGKALVADSSATVAGAAFGTSSTTSYIESASGIRAGGRTGLTAVAAAVLFLLALFFAPLAHSIPGFATAPAIVFVACMMARGLADIDWDDVTEFVPAVITALTMPLTFSIATGIGLGFIAYVAIKLACGRLADISIAMWVVSLTFLIWFVAV